MPSLRDAILGPVEAEGGADDAAPVSRGRSLRAAILGQTPAGSAEDGPYELPEGFSWVRDGRGSLLVQGAAEEGQARVWRPDEFPAWMQQRQIYWSERRDAAQARRDAMREEIGSVGTLLAEGAAGSLASTKKALGVDPSGTMDLERGTADAAMMDDSLGAKVVRGVGGMLADVPTIMMPGGALAKTGKALFDMTRLGARIGKAAKAGELGARQAYMLSAAQAAVVNSGFALRDAAVRLEEGQGVGQAVAGGIVQAAVPALFGKTGLDRAMLGGTPVVRESLLRRLQGWGLDLAMEGVEESATELAQALVDHTSGANPQAFDGLGENMLVSFLVGALVSGAVNAPSLADGSLESQAERIDDAQFQRMMSQIAADPTIAASNIAPEAPQYGQPLARQQDGDAPRFTDFDAYRGRQDAEGQQIAPAIGDAMRMGMDADQRQADEQARAQATRERLESQRHRMQGQQIATAIEGAMRMGMDADQRQADERSRAQATRERLGKEKEDRLATIAEERRWSKANAKADDEQATERELRRWEGGLPAKRDDEIPETAPAQPSSAATTDVDAPSGRDVVGFQVGQRVRFSRGKKTGQTAIVAEIRPDGRLVLADEQGRRLGKNAGITPSSLEKMTDPAPMAGTPGTPGAPGASNVAGVPGGPVEMAEKQKEKRNAKAEADVVDREREAQDDAGTGFREVEGARVNDAGSSGTVPQGQGEASEGERGGGDRVAPLPTPDPGESVTDEVAERPATSGITDVGEKLGGARKDRVRDSLNREFSADDIARKPLSEIWPLSDVEAVQDIEQASILFVVRSAIPTKPRAPYKVARWVKQVQELRALAKKLMDGNDLPALGKALDEAGSRSLHRLTDKMWLLRGIPREHWGRVDAVEDHSTALSYGGRSEDGKRKEIPSPHMLVMIDGIPLRFDLPYPVPVDRVAAIREQVVAVLSREKTEKAVQFEVRGSPGNWKINAKGDRRYRALAGPFATGDAAFAYIKENREALTAKWREISAPQPMQRSLNPDAKRIGKVRRPGNGDIDAETLQKTFGFRGIEFGNWTNQADRQQGLNQAYDGFMDLAEVLGVEPAALSLDGRLGLSFGGRGGGRAAAHYEPGRVVINLTRTKGEGTLAHEWAHAVDNAFARAGLAHLGENADRWLSHPSDEMALADAVQQGAQVGVWPEIAKAWAVLNRAIYTGRAGNQPSTVAAWVRRSNERGSGRSGDNYWTRRHELHARAFEVWTAQRLEDAGAASPYLVQGVPTQAATDPDSTWQEVYPQGQEALAINAAFDAWAAAIRKRWADAQPEVGEPTQDVPAMPGDQQATVPDPQGVERPSAGPAWSEDIVDGRTVRQTRLISGDTLRIDGVGKRDHRVFIIDHATGHTEDMGGPMSASNAQGLADVILNRGTTHARDMLNSLLPMDQLVVSDRDSDAERQVPVAEDQYWTDGKILLLRSALPAKLRRYLEGRETQRSSARQSVQGLIDSLMRKTTPLQLLGVLRPAGGVVVARDADGGLHAFHAGRVGTMLRLNPDDIRLGDSGKQKALLAWRNGEMVGLVGLLAPVHGIIQPWMEAAALRQPVPVEGKPARERLFSHRETEAVAQAMDTVQGALGSNATMVRTQDGRGFIIHGRGGVRVPVMPATEADVNRVQAGASGTVNGWFDADAKAIYVVPGRAGKFTVTHELYHAMDELGLITERQAKALDSAAQRRLAAERQAGNGGPLTEAQRLTRSESGDVQRKELIARLIEEEAAKPRPAGVFATIRRWFDSLASLVNAHARERVVIRQVLDGEPLARQERRIDQTNGGVMASTGDGTLVDAMLANPAPWRSVEPTAEWWAAEFGPTLTVQTPIGPVKLGENQRGKLLARERERYAGLIKPTLEQPALVIEDDRGARVFMRAFRPARGDAAGMVSVTYDKDGVQVQVTAGPRSDKRLRAIAESGRVLYRWLAEESPRSDSPAPGPRGERAPDSAGSMPANSAEGKSPLLSQGTPADLATEVEERMEAARGVMPRSLMDRVREAAGTLKDVFTRHFVHLNKETDGVMIDALRVLETARSAAPILAQRAVVDVVRGLDRAELRTFERILILNDIAKDVEAGLYDEKAIPFVDRMGDTLGPVAGRAARVAEALQAIEAKATPAVREALRRREQVHGEITQRLVDLKLLDDRVLSEPRYFHRQVLDHLTDAARRLSPRAKDARQRRRGWQRSRAGGYEFNTSYVEAEHEYLTQALAEIATATQLERIRQGFDLLPGLKREAKAQNMDRWIPPEIQAQIAAIKEQRREARAQGDRDIAAQLTAEIWQLDPRMPFRSEIAQAVQALGAELETLDGQALNVPFPIDDLLAQVEQQELYDPEETGGASGFDLGHPQAFPFLSWLMNQPPGTFDRMKIQAGRIFKAMAEQEAAMRRALGSEYVTWRDIIPEGFTTWQPVEGVQLARQWAADDKALSTGIGRAIADAIADVERTRSLLAQAERAQAAGDGVERNNRSIIATLSAKIERAQATADDLAGAMQALRDGNAGLADAMPETVTLRGQDLRQQQVVVGMKLEWVIPERLATQLDDMPGARPDSTLARVTGAPIRAWKQWILHGPLRFLKYNLNNLAGDTEVMATAVPGAFRYMPQALRDARAYLGAGEMDERTQARAAEAVRLGLLDSGQVLQEIPDITASTPALRSLEGKNLLQLLRQGELREALGSLLPRYLEATRGISALREGAYRLAAGRAFLAQIRAGKTPLGASVPAEMRALYAQIAEADGDEKTRLQGQAAAKLAREVLVDYGNTSVGGVAVSKQLIPFWRWMEGNAPRWWRLLRNQLAEGGMAGAGRAAGIRLAGTSVRGALVLVGIQAGIAAWNELMKTMLDIDDDEDPNRDANRQFILMPWRDPDGRVVAIGFASAFADALRWFGLHNPAQDAQQIMNGRGGEVLADSLLAAPNTLLNGVRPEAGVAIAATLGQQFFPEPMSGGRPIRDFGDYAANLFGMAPVYRTAMGDPRGGSVINEAWNLLGYSFDPGESSFFEARRLAYGFQDDIGKGGSRRAGQNLLEWLSGDPDAKRSLALNRFRMAIRRDDTEAAKRWLGVYIDQGGTAQGFATAARMSHPLAPVAQVRRDAFLDSLDARERETVERAIQWHEATWQAGGQAVNDLAREVFRERARQ